jgi:hypothetical protein
VHISCRITRASPSPARHLQTPRATRARQTPRAPNTPVGERQWAWRLTDEQGRRLQQIMRRGKHGSIRVRRAMIIMAWAAGTLVPPKAQIAGRVTARCDGCGMKYMVLMYSDPAATEAMSASDRAVIASKHAAFREDLAGSGELLNGAGLADPTDTTAIRWCQDGSATTDGPFIEAAEQLTAYYVIDCASPERARAIAGRVLDFHVTAVEVRPIHDSFGMGDT